MAWGKVDDRLHATRKWRRTSKGGRALWTTALSWCMAELTDGHVPADMLSTLDGNRQDVASLVASGLWHEDDNGWYFHDWLDYQPSREHVLTEREAAAERQRRAREKARAKRLAAEGVTGDVTRDSRRESRSPRPDPTRPDPYVVSHLGNEGGSKRRASSANPQPCGRDHDVAQACGACADARRAVKESAAENVKAASRQRSDAAKVRAERVAAAIKACDFCDAKGYTDAGKPCATDDDGRHVWASTYSEAS